MNQKKIIYIKQIIYLNHIPYDPLSYDSIKVGGGANNISVVSRQIIMVLEDKVVSTWFSPM